MQQRKEVEYLLHLDESLILPFGELNFGRNFVVKTVTDA
jgi:hypothetical protein